MDAATRHIQIEQLTELCAALNHAQQLADEALTLTCLAPPVLVPDVQTINAMRTRIAAATERATALRKRHVNRLHRATKRSAAAIDTRPQP